MHAFLLTATLFAWGQAPPDPRLEYDRLWELTGKMRLDEAIPALQLFLTRHPNHEAAYRTLARAFHWSKRGAEGKAFFQSLARKDDRDPMPYLGLLRLAELQRDATSLGTASRECVVRSADNPATAVCYAYLPNYFLQRLQRQPTIQEANQILPPASQNLGRFLTLALIHRYRVERREAVRIGSEGITRSAAAGHKTLEALLRLERYIVLRELGDEAADREEEDRRQAVRLFAEAGDREEEVGIALSIAARQVQRKDPRGEPLLQQLYNRVRGWGHRPLLSIVELELARIADLQGDLDTAIRLYRQSLQFTDAFEPTRSFDGYERMGHCYRRTGDYDRAIEAYRSISSLLPPGDALHAYVPRYLGDAYEETGDYWRSLEQHQASLRLFRQQSGAGWINTSGATLTRIGRIYTAIGDYSMAEANFRQALAIARRFGDPDPMQRLLSEWGSLYLKTGRPAEAVNAFREVIRLNERTRNPVFFTPALFGLGRAQAALGQDKDAASTLQQALGDAERQNMRTLVADIQLELGRLAIHRDPAAARSHFTAALEIAQSAGLQQAAVRAHEHLADVTPEPEALDHLRAAMNLLDGLRSLIPGPGLRASFAAENWKIYQKALRLLTRTSSAEAFHVSERGRSRSFLESLAGTGARFERGLTPEQRRQKRALAAAVSKAAAHALAAPGPAAQSAIQRAEQALQSWSSTVHAGRPDLIEQSYAAPATLEQVQASLPDAQTALVSFVLNEPYSHVFLVTRSGLRTARLPSARLIEREVRNLLQTLNVAPVDSRSSRAWEAPAAALHRLLFSNWIGGLRGHSRLILVRDGLLHHLPFEVIRAAGPGSRFLLEDFALTYAPSASAFGALAAARARPSRQARRALLAFGDPAVDHAAPASDFRGVLERSGALSFGPLPNARIEVRRIGALFPENDRDLFVGDQASEQAFKSARLRDYRRIHFATHAIVEEEFPLRSAILLSRGRNGEDGLLTLAEINDLELNADLVVISACRSGLGKVMKGEGLVGLTRSVLAAGSARVVVSLWNVNDATTVPFMESFYRGMQSAPTAEALRAAKLNMIRSVAPALRHPHYWAPFVLSGLF